MDLESIKNLNKNAILAQTKSAEIKIAVGNIMNGYFTHFQAVMKKRGFTSFGSAVVFSADLLAYWDIDTKKYLKCSRNPVSSEKGQGTIFNKNADDRTVEPSSRRKVTSKIKNAIELNIDWEKIESYKLLLETIKLEEEKALAQTEKEFAEINKDFVKTFHNSTEAKQKEILADLRKIAVNARTTTVGKKATKVKTQKTATKKVA